MITTVNLEEHEALKKQYNNLIEAFYDFKELEKDEISPELSNKIKSIKKSDTSHYSDLQEKYA